MKHYKDIEVMRPDFKRNFTLGDTITITEKIDGANASFDADLNAYSRKNLLRFDNTLRGFYNYVQSLPKDILAGHENWIVFGEWLVSHKVKYPEDKLNKFYVFDIWDKDNETWLPHDIVTNFCADKGLLHVPVFEVKTYDGDWDAIKKWVGHTVMGSEYGEGIVIKNQANCATVKIVCDTFKEKMKVREVDPAKEAAKERLYALTESIVTKARVDKMLYKLVDEGILPETWNVAEMGLIAKNLPKRIYEDCVKEENATVIEAGEGFGKACGSITMRLVRQILDEKNKI